MAEPIGGKYHERFKALVRGLNLSAVGGSVLERYNGKPVLTRPQHRMWQVRGPSPRRLLCPRCPGLVHTRTVPCARPQGASYFEVDIDVHIFNYLARRLFASFRHRITDALLLNAGCACRDSRAEGGIPPFPAPSRTHEDGEAPAQT